VSGLSDIQPTERPRVIDLVREAGVDVSDWSNFKGGEAKASTNPKYCYAWAFGEKGPAVALTLWFKDIKGDTELKGGAVNRRLDLSPKPDDAKRTHAQLKRRNKLEDTIKAAHKDNLTIRVIVVDGKMRDESAKKPKASEVKYRLLDPIHWGITTYDEAKHLYVLEQGASSTASPSEPSDVEVRSFVEGAERQSFVRHRMREWRLREQKLDQVRKANGGRLICEVPNCGFDFQQRYGDLGIGYAQVHHNKPLRDAPKEGRKVDLSELSVVCANCHVMIHVGGECRSLHSLIPK